VPDLKAYPQSATLRDGTAVQIRPIRPDDKQRLQDGFRRLTGRSVYLRFLGSKRELSAQELKYFTELDFKRHAALVVALPDGADERLIGVGRYIETGDGIPERVAEVAFAVDDEHQNRGVGTLLFEHIVALARDSGIARLQADMLPGNRRMLEILGRSGLPIERTVQQGVEHVELRIAGRDFKRS
jgi:GNAT superfamily N-acetyltransferase